MDYEQLWIARLDRMSDLLGGAKPARVNLEQTGLKEDGGIAHVTYRVVRQAS